MAPRTSWKGYLKLSLVSCPVRLYPATSGSERVSFNLLHKDTHNRINMKPVDPELGLVERSDLVKGYEYEPKQYVVIEDEDLEAVRIESNHTLNIEAFVDEDDIDVTYQDVPYYLAPDGKMADETFIVLREAMKKTGQGGDRAAGAVEPRADGGDFGARQGHAGVDAARPERGAEDRRVFRGDPDAEGRSRDAPAGRDADQRRRSPSSISRSTRIATRWRCAR